MGSTCDPSASSSTCPAGTICTPLRFSQALGHCMPACRSDGDCRSDLTCEWMVSYLGPSHGTYICWQDKAGGADCLSLVCNAKPSTGAKVCSAYCDDYTPCKLQQTCVPLGGCGSVPGCGGCF